jgi:hypothetical protein
MAKVFPIAGTKLLTSLMFEVPPRLTPFETARSPNDPADVPPMKMFSEPFAWFV